MQHYEINSSSIEHKLSEVTIVQVKGNSMLPELHDGDTLVVCKCANYNVGDILVFKYFNGSLLVHRLLMVTNSQYYCKGDNSFRLECINKTNIIGKVAKIVRNSILMNANDIEEKYIILSFRISRLFLRSQFKQKEVLQSESYRVYFENYLQKRTPNSLVNQLHWPIKKGDATSSIR